MEPWLTRERSNRSDERGLRQVLESLPATTDREVLSAAARCLGDPSPSVCEAAVSALAKCGNSVAAEVAAESLWADEAAQREYALEALVQLGPASVETLIRLLQESDRDIRKYAADALGRIGDPSALHPLVAALDDEDVNVAVAAAEAIGLIRAPEAVPALSRAFARGHPWLKIAALSSLGSIGTSEAVQAICAVPRESAQPMLLTAAATAAGRAGNADRSRALTFLTSLLAEPHPMVAESALTALGELLRLGGCPDLSDEDYQGIDGASRAALASPSPQQRASALTCLGVTGWLDPEGSAALAASSLREDPEASVRLAALQALAAMGKENTIDLVALAGSTAEDASVRLLALRLLAQTGGGNDQKAEAELSSIVETEWEPVLRVAALHVLVKRGAATSAALGVGLLCQEEVPNEEAAMKELSGWPLEDLVPLLQLGLADTQPKVRQRILTAILPMERAAEISGSQAVRAILHRVLTDTDRRLRLHVIRLAAAHPGPWALEILRRACDDPDRRVRGLALQILRDTSSPLEARTALAETWPAQNGQAAIPRGFDQCSS